MQDIEITNFIFERDDGWWRAVIDGLEIYVAGVNSEPDDVHWTNALNATRRSNEYIVSAKHYASEHFFGANGIKQPSWDIRWFGFGAPDFRSPIEFHVALELIGDDYGLWSVSFRQQGDNFRPIRLARQDW